MVTARPVVMPDLGAASGIPTPPTTVTWRGFGARQWCVVRCASIGRDHEYADACVHSAYLRESLVGNGAVELFHVVLGLELAVRVELVAAQSSAGRRGLEVRGGHARDGELAGRLRERLDRERLHHFLGLDRGVVLPGLVAKADPDVVERRLERDLGANLRSV